MGLRRSMASARDRAEGFGIVALTPRTDLHRGAMALWCSSSHVPRHGGADPPMRCGTGVVCYGAVVHTPSVMRHRTTNTVTLPNRGLEMSAEAWCLLCSVTVGATRLWALHRTSFAGANVPQIPWGRRLNP